MNYKRQVHFWLTEEGYRFLVEAAEADQCPVGSFLRRLLERERVARVGESRCGSGSQSAPNRQEAAFAVWRPLAGSR